jgi:hypothetical protein
VYSSRSSGTVLSFASGAIATGAAEILPQRRGLELYSVDLSVVVDVEASSRRIDDHVGS